MAGKEGDFTSMYTLQQVCTRIAQHYNRDLPSLRVRMPSQVVDGAVVSIYADTTGSSHLATCRARICNVLRVDKNTGTMHIDVQLSDIAFTDEPGELIVQLPT
jgi:hypothetical protein